MGCTIQQILTAPGMVVEGGLLSILVFPKKSKALELYLGQHASRTKCPTLTPNGVVVTN